VTRSSQTTESAAQSRTVDRGGAVWDGFVPLEHSKLLPKCYRFQREFVPGHQKGADVREHHENEHDHQSMLVNGDPVEGDPEPKSLIFIRKQCFDDPQRLETSQRHGLLSISRQFPDAGV
jgi:hypothetical protein